MEDNKPTSAVAPITGAQTAEAQIPQEQKLPQPGKDSETDARFAALARKEKQIRHQARQLEQQRRQWEEAQKTKPTPPPSIDDFKSRLLDDPTSIGLSYDQLAQVVLNQGNPVDQTAKQLQREIAALRAELDGQKKSQAEAQENSYKQALKQVERDVRKAVDSNESFETIKAAGQHEAVVSLIEQTFKEDGVLMGVEEAAAVIEEQLLEHAVSLAKLKKVQAKLTPAQAAQVSTEDSTGAPQASGEPMSDLQAALAKRAQEAKKRSLTITNRLNSNSASVTGNSERDRIARAIAAAQGNK